jgi:hypothetical protein
MKKIMKTLSQSLERDWNPGPPEHEDECNGEYMSRIKSRPTYSDPGTES